MRPRQPWLTMSVASMDGLAKRGRSPRGPAFPGRQPIQLRWTGGGWLQRPLLPLTKQAGDACPLVAEDQDATDCPLQETDKRLRVGWLAASV